MKQLTSRQEPCKLNAQMEPLFSVSVTILSPSRVLYLLSFHYKILHPIELQQENLHITMDFKAELNTQVAEEDDGYYAEIRKQIILLLTALEDDDDVERPPKTAAKRGAEQSGRRHPQPERNLSWCLNGNDLEGPVWHVNSWENGNGTGVFIPQAVKYKRYSIFSMFLSCLSSFISTRQYLT